jgi:rod shape determining protein RodA
MQRAFRHFDWILLTCTLMLLAYGVAMIYSSAPPIGDTGSLLDEFYIRQIAYIALGLVGMVILAIIDYRIWETWPRIPYLLAVGLLAIVALSGLSQFSAQRWVDFLGLFPVQPSEAAKILLIISLAKYLADRESESQRWYHIIISLLLAGIPAGLIYLQPNLTTSLVFMAIWFGMLLMWGMRARYLLIIAGVGALGLVVFFLTAQDYQLTRLASFVNPNQDPLGKDYNITQARITIGSGGWTGQGYRSGSQSQLRFLRARQTDFIFSVLGEELGFLGATVFFALIIVVCFRMLRAAELARDAYGRLIVSGLTVMLFVQTLVNLGVNVGLLPVAGIPLPFMSFGGSSVISVLLGQGLAQSVLMRHRRLEFE